MIRKLLVANRGEIAVRVIRSAHDAGIECVVVHSDADASALHVGLADEAVRLPGNSPAETYLRSDLIVEAAARSGADAVHPGYGFLSESAAFASACTDADLTFVGPPASVIEAMGSKLAAKATMAAAGVPLLPQVEVTGDTDVAVGSDLLDRAQALGSRLLVKASAGGGGRGMRVVDEPASLVGAIESARREATSAFGDGTLFIEPYASRPRHIEVQVLGDTHGNVVHLFERECSIQRRHQKIIEESPSPALDPAARESLCATAVTAARAIGYVNAGTVEFLMLEDGTFAFLEVNTRLQVEHPVTELVTGLDLVRLQLLVAEGRALPAEALSAEQNGHAIEVRLYAEDPMSDWRPSVGSLHRFSIGGGRSIRIDTGVEDGSEVSPWYDPMLAKVISYSPTRDEAARSLASALAGSQLHGITTNRDLLVRILRHPEFLSGAIDTGFLTRNDPAVLGAPLASKAAMQLHAIAAALAGQARRRADARVLGGVPSGWRNNPSDPQQESFSTDAGELEVSYRFDRAGRCNEARCTFKDESTELVSDPASIGTSEGLVILCASAREVVLEHGGVRRSYAVQILGDTVYVDGPDGSSTLNRIERFALPGSRLVPGSLVAPLPGTVVRVMVAAGDEVVAGEVLVAIEAMKMEHEVHAGHDGTVEDVAVAPGDQVESGRLLVVIKEG